MKFALLAAFVVVPMAVLPFISLAWQGDAPPPAIAKDGVVNSASQMPPEFGGGRIARGSLVRIRGWRLGPDKQVRAAEPLLPTLGGMSVEIRRGGAMVHALPVSVSANEIEAVVPPDAPLGKADIVVLKDGDPGVPFSIEIVESSFGAFSRNGQGWGPGKVRNGSALDQDANANSLEHPARPGQTITLEGTGLGAHNPMSILAGGKLVSRIRDAKRSSCCGGTDELSFDLPSDTPEGCYVPLRVQAAPGIVSNVVTVSVSRGGRPCSDPGNWLPRQLEGVSRVGFAGLLNADVRLFVDRQEASFNFDYGFAKFVATPPGPSQLDRYYLFPPYGSCTGYNRIAQGREMTSMLTTLNIVQGVPIDAGGLLTVSGGAEHRPIGLSNAAAKSLGAVLGGRSPFPSGPQLPLFLRPQTYQISGGAGTVGPFQAPVTVSKAVRWNNRARVSIVDRSQGVSVEWTPANPDDSIVITAMNIDSDSGASGVCECVAPARAGHFTIPPAALTNIPPTRKGDSLPLNLLIISEFPGRAPAPFAAPGLDRAFAFFFSTSARSVEFR